MKAWQALLGLFRKAGSVGSTSLTAMSSEMIRRLGNPSKSGQAVSEATVMGISAAWGCMRILSETIGAAIPWGIYEEDKAGNAKRVDDHELAEVLVRSPNRDMTSVEFREALVLNLCQAGNAYCLIERLGGAVVSLYPVKAREMKPMRKQGSNTKLAIAEGEVFYRWNNGGYPEDLPRDRVWHVKGFGEDGLEGLSPIGAARETMGFALATEAFGSQFFKQGAMPAGTVSFPGWLTPQQKTEAQEALQAMIGGLGNAHQIALFQGGMKPEPWGNVPLKDMEFLMLRQFSVAEICRFYRVPPHMVADLSRATFSNIEHQGLEFLAALLPYFRRLESSTERWLTQPKDRGRIYLRFNVEGLLRADSKGRAEFLSLMVNNGLMSRNEARAKENLNRSDLNGMDDFTVQLAMTPIDKLGQAPVEPAPRKSLDDFELRIAASERKSAERIAEAIAAQKPPVVTVNSTPEINVAPPAQGPMTVNVENKDVDAMQAQVTSLAGGMAEGLAAIQTSMERAATAHAQLGKSIERLADSTADVIVEAEVRNNATIANAMAGIKQVADAVALVAAATAQMADAIGTGIELIGEKIDGLAEAQLKPRKAVLDKDGNVIGSEAVDKL